MKPTPAPSRLLTTFRALRAERGGAVAVLFALMLIPLILATGAAADFARMEILRTSLQSVADGAALAGASALCLSTASTSAATVATDYFNKGVAALATTATVSSPTVTIPSTIKVTVSATATLQYSFMSLIGKTISVPITSSAEGPAYQLQVTRTGGFSSSAADSNSIYFYIVSSDGTVPTSTTSMTLLFTNDPAVDPNYVTDNTLAKSIRVGANDAVGFALVNKTGGISSYSQNAYGGTLGSTHYFYSSNAVPSSTAYASQGTFHTGTVTTGWNYFQGWTSSCSKTAITTTTLTTDYVPTVSCNAHPCTAASNGVVLQNNLLVGGACSTPSSATQTCLQLYSNPLSFAWNDMGGGTDDFDYNDANYTVSCVPSTSTTTQPNSVILVQ